MSSTSIESYIHTLIPILGPILLYSVGLNLGDIYYTATKLGFIEPPKIINAWTFVLGGVSRVCIIKLAL